MGRRIVIIQGHPDPAGGHLCHALAGTYADAAREAGHAAETIAVAGLRLPLLETKEAFDGPAPPEVAQIQDRIAAANHLVLLFPLWLGGMPAMLKGALEQIFRPGFVLLDPAQGWGGRRRLAGVSARIVVTMGMPALAYRWRFGAHGVKSLDSGILRFAGITPVRTTFLGSVDANDDACGDGIAAMRRLGAEAK